MGRYVLRRVVQLVPLIIGITLITFLLANAIPGSPVSQLEFNPHVTPADKARITEQLGLNQPLHVRYIQWLSHVMRGDLGISLVTYRPVAESILEKLPNTLLLTGAALVISLLFSVPVGVYAATRRNSWFDQFSTIGAVAGVAVPNFWLGLMMILLFSVKFNEWGLPSLPAIGSADGGGIGDRLLRLIMPAIALAFVQTASWTRYIRSQMIEVLRQDYVRSAEAKGLRYWVMIYRHALRNALLPLVTLLALDLPTLFGGAIITERVFSWNGLGRFFLDSVSKRDYTVVMGVVLMLSSITVIANLLADIAYAVLDPRVRYD